MKYIDHHAHMVSRTTDDYQHMSLSGCVAVTEPAFWAGWDRSHADGFEDYFRQLTDFEPKRAAQYHIQHYAWMAMNPKEADDRELSREVLKRIPKFLDRPTVLGIGEIGLNRVTRNEIDTYTEQIELALAHKQLILIHTPHLEDKLKGTKISVDVLRSFPTLEPGRVLVDHAEEHTLQLILDHGYWAGLTLYPQTKVSAQRAADIVERFGPDRICIAGACDWGPSDSMAVPRFIMEMRRRKHSDALIHRLVFENPVQFLSQSARFKIRPLERPNGATRFTGIGFKGFKRFGHQAQVTLNLLPGELPRTIRELRLPLNSNEPPDQPVPPHLLHEHPRGGRVGRRVRQPQAIRAGAQGALLAVGAVRRRTAALGARGERVARGRPAARVSRVPRPRGLVRCAHQRLPVRPLSRHAGQSQRLRTGLA